MMLAVSILDFLALWKVYSMLLFLKFTGHIHGSIYNYIS